MTVDLRWVLGVLVAFATCAVVGVAVSWDLAKALFAVVGALTLLAFALWLLESDPIPFTIGKKGQGDE